jgi:hypothetical protein
VGHRSKFISFLQAQDDIERARFQDWFLQHGVAGLPGQVPGLAGLVVNLVIDPPANRPRRGYEEAVHGRGYDVVLECWMDGAEDCAGVSARMNEPSLAHQLSRRDEYRVDESIIVDRGMSCSEGVTPGIKYIGRLLFHSDLPESAARRSWAIHGELAASTFLKMTRYVQNFIQFPLGTDAPPASGMPELYFDRIEDYMATPPGGHERIGHDLRHLISSGIRLYTIEHVLMAPQMSVVG